MSLILSRVLVLTCVCTNVYFSSEAVLIINMIDTGFIHLINRPSDYVANVQKEVNRLLWSPLKM